MVAIYARTTSLRRGVATSILYVLISLTLSIFCPLFLPPEGGGKCNFAHLCHVGVFGATVRNRHPVLNLLVQIVFLPYNIIDPT